MSAGGKRESVGRGRLSPWGKQKSHEGRCAVGELAGVGSLIDRIVNAGDAIMFSRTSDGGALVVTLYAGEERHKTYAPGQEELDEAWEALAQAYPEVAK